jgi:starch phosphorylase
MAKRAMTTILPRFNAERMLAEYVQKFYVTAAQRGREYQAAHCAAASVVARWKERVRAAWPQVSIHRLGTPARYIIFGERVQVEAAVNLNGLSAQDVVVELVLENAHGSANRAVRRIALTADEAPQRDGTLRYMVDLAPDMCGKLDYRILAYPSHPLLTHPFELGLTIWV